MNHKSSIWEQELLLLSTRALAAAGSAVTSCLQSAANPAELTQTRGHQSPLIITNQSQHSGSLSTSASVQAHFNDGFEGYKLPVDCSRHLKEDFYIEIYLST